MGQPLTRGEGGRVRTRSGSGLASSARLFQSKFAGLPQDFGGGFLKFSPAGLGWTQAGSGGGGRGRSGDAGAAGGWQARLGGVGGNFCFGEASTRTDINDGSEA